MYDLNSLLQDSSFKGYRININLTVLCLWQFYLLCLLELSTFALNGIILMNGRANTFA